MELEFNANNFIFDKIDLSSVKEDDVFVLYVDSDAPVSSVCSLIKSIRNVLHKDLEKKNPIIVLPKNQITLSVKSRESIVDMLQNHDLVTKQE